MVRAKVYHRFNRKNVPVFDFGPFSGCTVIRYLGILMHFATDTVTHIFPDDGVAMRFGVFLDSPTNVPKVFPVVTLPDRTFKTLFGDADQIQQFGTDISDRNSCRGVADKSFQGGAAVNRKYVAAFQFVSGRKAMHHLFVDGGANTEWKAVVTLERGQRPCVPNHFF